MKVNRSLLVLCLFLLCIGTVWTVAIFGQSAGDIVDFVRYVGKGAKWVNDAASAYYNIQQIIDDLKVEKDELEAELTVAQGIFTEQWNNYQIVQGKYDAASDDMWAANDDYKDAENRRISAIGDINAAESRIAYCNTMLDGTTSSEMWEYWQEERAKAESNLSDAKSKKSTAVNDKANANTRYKNARARMSHYKLIRTMWKNWVDIAKNQLDIAQARFDDKKKEIKAKKIEKRLAKDAFNKALAAYNAAQEEDD